MARKALGASALAVVAAVRATLESLAEENRTFYTVRIACSGGADSLALAAAAAWVQRHHLDPMRQLSALVVDHGLQLGSAAVAATVVEQLATLEIPATVQRVQVDTDSGLGMEAAAREARYAALRADAPDFVLLGHTLDDQAETVLLGLARGSGVRSLAGMPEHFSQSPKFIRPLLQLRRSVTAQACAEFGLTPWQDPQNADPRFLRVRVRNELIPALSDVLGSEVVESLARTATLARAAADHLDTEAATALTQARTPENNLSIAVVLDLPEAIRPYVIRLWLATLGIKELSFERTQAVLDLVTSWHGQGPCQLSGGTITRTSGTLRFTPTPSP
jgi:tRNA(Ile)-lysidine synthase